MSCAGAAGLRTPRRSHQIGEILTTDGTADHGSELPHDAHLPRGRDGCPTAALPKTVTRGRRTRFASRSLELPVRDRRRERLDVAIEKRAKRLPVIKIIDVVRRLGVVGRPLHISLAIRFVEQSVAVGGVEDLGRVVKAADFLKWGSGTIAVDSS